MSNHGGDRDGTHEAHTQRMRGAHLGRGNRETIHPSAPVCKFCCPGCGLNLRVALAAVRLEVARLGPPPPAPSTSSDESSGPPSTASSGPKTQPVPPSGPPPARLLRRTPPDASRPRGPPPPPPAAIAPADSSVPAGVPTVGDKPLPGSKPSPGCKARPGSKRSPDSKPTTGKAGKAMALPSTGEWPALPIGSRVSKATDLAGGSSSLAPRASSGDPDEPADVNVHKRVRR